MSEQIREQVSAFLDGELPNTETELLLKRLTRDAELRESFGRYALMGESHLSRGFTARVNRVIDGEPTLPEAPAPRGHVRRWRPLAGAAVAAGVAVFAVVALQQRAVAPTLTAAEPASARTGAVYPSSEPVSYTVPAAVGAAPTAMPPARLTNYVFAHGTYSSGLGQSNVWSGLVSGADAEAAAGNAAGPAMPERVDTRTP